MRSDDTGSREWPAWLVVIAFFAFIVLMALFALATDEIDGTSIAPELDVMGDRVTTRVFELVDQKGF